MVSLASRALYFAASVVGPTACVIITRNADFEADVSFYSLVRGNRPGKPVQLQEYEIKYLCTKAREIFINQPILLELEAPIKICGESPCRLDPRAIADLSQ